MSWSKAEESLAVRPHPHINLATVTYLFEGEILHRDSTGVTQAIRPGAINWMTAGEGIVHSERAREEVREAGGPLHGLQIWIALPREHEETAPAFHHHPADSLPRTRVDDAEVRVMIGAAYGLTSPVATFSPMLYVDVDLPAGARLPAPGDVPELAAYLVSGRDWAAGRFPKVPGDEEEFIPLPES